MPKTLPLDALVNGWADFLTVAGSQQTSDLRNM